MLDVNDKPPLDIQIPNSEGRNVALADYLGKYIVLYFYPKNNTPGCTMEACSFRDYNDEIKDLGVKVLGVSKDSIDSHQKFQKKHNLSFELLSDASLKLHKVFGTWVQKSMFGKKYMGAQRATFIIDPEGKIIRVWPKVKPNGHGKEVYEYLNELVRK